MRPITFVRLATGSGTAEDVTSAVRAALDHGARGVAANAWPAAGGEVVLAPEPLVRRGLRRHRVADTTAADLARLGIPGLGDLYAACGTAFELAVTVDDVPGGAAVLAEARAAGALDQCWCAARDVDTLAALRTETGARFVHEVHRDTISVPLERYAAGLATAGIDAVAFPYTDWSAGLVALFHRFGVRVFAQDAREVRHVVAVLEMGVDAVSCARPERLVAAVDAWSAGRGAEG